MRSNREVNESDLRRIGIARDYLMSARTQLKVAGARKAARYLSRALKSLDGARRHASAMLSRKEWRQQT